MIPPRSPSSDGRLSRRLHGRALLALAGALLGGCIERPYQDAPAPKPQVDRSAVREALVSSVPEGTTPVGAVFGNAVELVGWRAEPPQIVPGQKLRLTLFWRCKAELEAWHIFVHLDDATGGGERIHAEHDPVQGRYPTDAWRPGDLIADSFVVTAGRTPLNLYLGFYSSGENRLLMNGAGRGHDDGQNRLLAGTIPLAK